MNLEGAGSVVTSGGPSETSRKPTILFVDDDPQLLAGFRRELRDCYDVRVAESGPAALAMLDGHEPFPVVVSDYRMPGMDGVAFLEQVAARHPQAIRILLTGHADLEMAMRAVNQGRIFRLLCKPCQGEELKRVLNDGVRQHSLLEAERELYALKKLQEGLESLIHALVKLVETKDPYTAGHQARVAKLAVDIAERMGLPPEKRQQIHLASLVHDLGKIYVPADFLTKPGALNPVEMNIIKMHPQIGHDILETVHFDFPIHLIVQQHHERIDGSGYPQGLRDQEILLEAKIIAVADVVEAISHHRPYRPALGMDQALAVIRAGRGSAFDPRVVDAADHLLGPGGFSF